MTHKTSTFKNNHQFSEFQVTPNSRNVNPPSSNVINSHNAGNYNYVEQYYEVQIETLNNKINEMSTELKRYRNLYSSKQSELEDLN